MAVLKGAFVNLGAGLIGKIPTIVVFQYNPERVTRTPRSPQEREMERGAGRRDARRRAYQPSERFGFTLHVDATDQIAAKNPIAIASGVLPALSALELLMVPKRALTIDLFRMAGRSAPYQLPPDRLPTVLLSWGLHRLWPVNVTSLSITETQYDTKLVPVRAEVEVALKVLTPNQLGDDRIGNGAYKYSQGVKETMAALNVANSALLVAGEIPWLPS